MTIRQNYLELLEHLGPTVTVGEFKSRSSDPDLVALRHDVDHDMDLALAMAHHEHDMGRSATYFILHTAPYVQEEHFIEKCLQLQEYGHEVGLHLNALTPWCAGETDDPIGDLEAWLDRLRDAGVDIVGSAAHGDRACYEHGFINYWIWSELRGGDPAASEDGLTAEGVAMGAGDRSVSYPLSHVISRQDGATFPLWSVPMESLGLSYEACRLQFDGYWSDSGGSWKRSPDPMGHDLSTGRHQVLIHPIWWITLPRYESIMQLEASLESGAGAAGTRPRSPNVAVGIYKGIKGRFQRGAEGSLATSHVMLDPCATWNKAKPSEGMVADADWCRGSLTCDLQGSVGPVRLFLLAYDKATGKQIQKYQLGVLKPGHGVLDVDVPVQSGSLVYALAVHFGEQPDTCMVELSESSLELCQRFGPAGNRLSSQPAHH
ncbi:MAG: hypothetical protein VX527_08845 [Planctomycetota bacterium]|nr:hypothetical protein [Planctomycetota bacterium]